MRTTKSLIGAILIPFCFMLSACDVDKVEEGRLPDVDVDVNDGQVPKYDVDVRKTQEGKLPDVDVDVKDGKLPKYDVDGPDVDVQMKEKTIKVPDVDVDMPEDETPD